MFESSKLSVMVCAGGVDSERFSLSLAANCFLTILTPFHICLASSHSALRACPADGNSSGISAGSSWEFCRVGVGAERAICVQTSRSAVSCTTSHFVEIFVSIISLLFCCLSIRDRAGFMCTGGSRRPVINPAAARPSGYPGRAGCGFSGSGSRRFTVHAAETGD